MSSFSRAMALVQVWVGQHHEATPNILCSILFLPLFYLFLSPISNAITSQSFSFQIMNESAGEHALYLSLPLILSFPISFSPHFQSYRFPLSKGFPPSIFFSFKSPPTTFLHLFVLYILIQPEACLPLTFSAVFSYFKISIISEFSRLFLIFK